MTEKDGLLKTLQGFNEGLRKKVQEATEKLRLAQENMVRTETLAAVGNPLPRAYHMKSARP